MRLHVILCPSSPTAEVSVRDSNEVSQLLLVQYKLLAVGCESTTSHMALDKVKNERLPCVLHIPHYPDSSPSRSCLHFDCSDCSKPEPPQHHLAQKTSSTNQISLATKTISFCVLAASKTPYQGICFSGTVKHKIDMV